MQKANRLLWDHSLPRTVSLVCIPTLDSSKENICCSTLALLQTPGLARIPVFPLIDAEGAISERACVCACVSVAMCMEEFEFTPKSCSSLLGDRFYSKDYHDSCSYVLHTTFYNKHSFRKHICAIFFSPCPSSYLLNVKRHKRHKDSLSCNGQQFQMFSCILSIFKLRTCQDTVLSMQRFWQGYLWSQTLLKLASAQLNFSTSLKNLA